MSKRPPKPTVTGTRLKKSYKGFFLWFEFRGWYVYAPDGEQLSGKLSTEEAAKKFVDRHIRRGGK